MALRNASLALMLALLASACGDNKGETSQATTTSDGATGGSTTSQSTTSEPTSTDGSTSGQTSGEPDPAIKEDCVAANAAEVASTMMDCVCLVEWGEFPDVETCLKGFRLDPEGQMEAACVCEVSALDPSNADLEACRRKKEEAYLACITPLTCADDVGHLDCLDLSICGTHSDQSRVQIALQCRGEKPIMCASGETIPESWVCNGEAECMDGSDEKNC